MTTREYPSGSRFTISRFSGISISKFSFFSWNIGIQSFKILRDNSAISTDSIDSVNSSEFNRNQSKRTS
ncbi:TPA: hypothetical protein ACXOG3_003721, partial [Clostridioides difficile]